MLFNVLGAVLPMGINFAATPFILHGLGPDGYGLQNLVGLVIGYFTIMDMGLDIAAVTFLAEFHARGDDSAQARLLNTNLQLYTVIGGIGLLAIALSAPLLASSVFAIPPALRASAVTVFRLAAIGFLANMLLSWGGSVARGLQRYDLYNVLAMLNTAGGVGLGVVAIYRSGTVVGYVGTRIAVTCAVALAYIVVVRRLVPAIRLRLHTDRAMLRRVGGVAVYGLILRVSGFFTSGVDRTLLGVSLGTAAVAFYAVPSMVATALLQLVTQSMSFLLPMVSELSSTGQTGTLRTILTRSTRFVFAAGTLSFVPATILADVVLRLWVGPQVAAASSGVFRILLAASFLSSFSILAATVVPGLGRFRDFTIYSVGKSFLIAAACALLIPSAGMVGAAYGVLAGSVVDVLYTPYALRRHLGLSLGDVLEGGLGPLALAAGALGLVVWVAHPHVSSWLGLGTALAGGVGVFLGLGFALKGFGAGEVQALRTLARMVLALGPAGVSR